MKHQENDVKETKKTRKKRSARTAQQIKLAVIMIMVSVLVLSASTFAWYQLSNTARITNMEFTAETMGSLKISASDSGPYSDTLDLSEDDTSNKTLLPCTTADGTNFYSPKYSLNGTEVESVTKIEGDTKLTKYVYKKVFYLKAEGESGRNLDLKLDPGKIVGETQIKSGTLFRAKAEENNNAVNAVRISFEFENSNGNIVKIYEPNTDKHNNEESVHLAKYNSAEYGPEKYSAIKQNYAGDFVTDTDTTLCRITEGTAQKVTMYVWFEGMDDDCVSEIALTQIAGQIQFRAEEHVETNGN